MDNLTNEEQIHILAFALIEWETKTQAEKDQHKTELHSLEDIFNKIKQEKHGLGKTPRRMGI